MSEQKTKKKKSGYKSSVFAKMREKALKNEEKNGSKDFIHLEEGNTYVVRIVPNIENPDATIVKYIMHGWNSLLTGTYLSFRCKKDTDEVCPACNERYKLYREKTEESEDLARKLNLQTKYYMDVYVVSDPTNPDNEGQVKVLRCGKQIYKIINEAINGEDAEIIGERMIDFSEEGCNLRIKVEKNAGGYNNYEMSKFLPPSSIPVTAEELQDKLHDFDGYIKEMSTSEIETMIKKHLYCDEGTEGNHSTHNKNKNENDNGKDSSSASDDVVDIDDDLLSELDDF